MIKDAIVTASAAAQIESEAFGDNMARVVVREERHPLARGRSGAHVFVNGHRCNPSDVDRCQRGAYDTLCSATTGRIIWTRRDGYR